MSSSSEISHRGRVTEVSSGSVNVEIVSESACASCHAKQLCGGSDSKVKTISVPARDGFSVGDEVIVSLKASMGHKAVWLSYVLPLAVLMGTILAGSGMGLGELAAGLLSIGAVAFYYFVIWLLRDRLRNQYIFNIKTND